METGEESRTNTLDLFRVDGKNAIVTGGGRGLGQHMAEALSDAGASVVLCSRKGKVCEEVAHEIESRGGRALGMSCDVTQPEDVENVVRVIEETFGTIDILVNNSGATWGGSHPGDAARQVPEGDGRQRQRNLPLLAGRWAAHGRAR